MLCVMLVFNFNILCTEPRALNSVVLFLSLSGGPAREEFPSAPESGSPR